MLRVRVIHVSICAALALYSAFGAGWKWEGLPPLPHLAGLHSESPRTGDAIGWGPPAILVS